MTDEKAFIALLAIKVPGKTSIVEITVDAGTGKPLSKVSEVPKTQAAEAGADRAAAKAKS